MALPRSKYVQEGKEGVYHCFSRCVRRAFLYGFDTFTGRDFSHRKAWIVDRLRYLAAIFAIEVCAYSIMENHYHTILRTRPDIVAQWSDREVATRWLTLFPLHRHSPATSPLDEDISTLILDPERIAKLRLRLSSLSWFMGRLNEFIARAANKEDLVKGRFWEGRFKSQALLDDAAIAACMVYVDLNPIRAGLASAPENSNFTSIQERIRAWQMEMATAASCSASQTAQLDPPTRNTRTPKDNPEIPNSNPSPNSNINISIPTPSATWLCPIRSDSRRRGILRISDTEYFQLVDSSGRILRSHKSHTIDPDLAPLLLRISANPNTWPDTISTFGSRFRLAAGLLPTLRSFASQLGRRWLIGVAAARTAFA